MHFRCLRVALSFAGALLFITRVVYAAVALHGVIRDPLGAPLAGADIVIATPERSPVDRASSDAEGRFQIEVPAPGQYLLIVTAPGFTQMRHAVTVTASAMKTVDLALQIAGLEEDVTVTAAPGLVQDARTAGQPINVIDARQISDRVRTVVAEAVAEEAGVQLQRTSPTMAGVFVRGLTGNKVNVFVDGVRYSTGAQRGGVNTFLDLIEPGMLESIEILRGPSSAQYGSDALGGSIQFLTRVPSLADGRRGPWGGSFSVSGGSSHRTGGAELFGAYSGQKVGLTSSLAGRKTGTLRTGQGIDSHAAATRFLGIRSDVLMGKRLPSTEFQQGGGSVRAHWAVSSRSRVIASFARSQQDGGERYDQLLGGDGNLISELNDLSLDFGSVRLERLGTGFADYLALTYSLNSQREERVNQGGNGNATATIGHEPERTTVHGVQGTLSRQLSSRAAMTAGADVYVERLTSDAFNVNPVTGAVSVRRPRVPDGATFRQGGAYVQSTFDAVPDRVRLLGAVRFGGVSYKARAADSPLAGGLPLWPDDSLTASSPTFRASVVMTPDAFWTVSGSVSRGFRAPHMTDLGTLGLTGSGFEVAAPDVAALGGFVGTTADGAAVTTGAAVEQLGPETSLQYDGSVGYRRPRWRVEFTAFVNTIDGNIQKQALILPAGAVGKSLGGTPIVSQNANGVVFVAATTVPVLVRANFDRARVWGLEHSGHFTIATPLSLQTVFTFLRAKDTVTGLSPNIEGGTPAPEAYLIARWQRPQSKWWVEPYLHIGWKQTHLSSLDLGDRRIGAGRTRASIQAFFRNGARNRGWIGAGPDATFGNADDVLLATGETLAQIQDRVLGVGVTASSLFTAVPGYAATGVRFGVKAGRHQLSVHAENLTDKNYRGISWGVDAPGRGISARYSVTY
ncbi:MAG: TonB-dependent receptor [Vicinamibacterales bacterium]